MSKSESMRWISRNGWRRALPSMPFLLLAVLAGLFLHPQRSLGGQPAPGVSAVSPTFGPTGGGTVVTITGSGFLSVTAVTFGAIAAASYTVNSATSITATAPPQGAGTVDITVTVLSTSSTSPADRFTYIPAITSTPTLGEWSMLALALLLAGAGYLALIQFSGRRTAT
jgi:hypothetical protein